MKTILENKKAKIFLENKDILEISTIDGKHNIIIKYIGGAFHIEDENLNLDNIMEEKKAIKAMDEYLKKYEKE